jgi:hypothetical protein
MLESALRCAERGIALSYPQDRWYVRAGNKLANARRARKSGFRTYVHPPARMLNIIEGAGFTLAVRRRTLVWSIDVFVRQ